MPHAVRKYEDLSRPLRTVTFVVTEPEAGMRVDALLRAHFPWRSRHRFQGMLSRGEVTLNDRSPKASARVRPGDRVAVAVPVDAEAPEQEVHDDLVFLYEDEHIAAIDKPSGMTVHPVGRTRHGTLLNKLHARYRSADPARDIVPRLGHRIDRDTSGVVLIVKHRRADQVVTDLFTHRRVEKTYLALVCGAPAASDGVVDAPIGKDEGGDLGVRMAVRPDGQPARSRWRVVERYARHAMLALEPLSGRTHQLRVHMAHAGMPILCDHLYGDVRPLCRSHADPAVAPADDGVILERLALHNHRLRLPHPITREPLDLVSPMPEDFRAATDALARLVGTRAG